MVFRAVRIAVTTFAAILPAGAQVPSHAHEQAVFISGEVALEDGTKPADPVRVQRVCKGTTHDEIWTDANGQFSFKVVAGGNDTAGGAETATRDTDLARPIGNSTFYSNPITSELRDCEVRAVMAGYWSDRVAIAMKNTLDSTRVGKIVLHPVSKADTFTVSATTLAAPSNARKAFEKGEAALRDRHWDAAEKAFNKAVAEYPKFAIAWFEIGLLRQNKNDTVGAVKAWQASLAADPKYVRPYESLAALAQRLNDWTDAEKYSHDWIQVDPEAFPMAYLYSAVAEANLNKLEEAEAAARHGLRLDKDHKIARLNYVLGLLLMQKHENAESAKFLRTYLELAPNAADALAVRAELVKLEAAASK